MCDRQRLSLTAVLKALDNGPWKTRIAEPKQKGFARWRGDEAARRAVTNNRTRLLSGVAKEAFKLRAEIVERSFAHNLDRGGMRRTWLRGRENVHKRYLLQVAGHNLSLLMRQLIGAGTPREAVAGGYGGIFVLLTPTGAMLVALGVSQSGQTVSPPHSSSGSESRKKPLNQRAVKVASRVRGLSDEAFREAFGAEEQCRSALSRLRWPDGFVCPACGHRGHCVLAGRSLYQCYRCKKQTSSTAGTIFHTTKLPLTLWFAAVHLIVTAKNGISSVELGRRLGVKQPTAWTMKHKIMAVMARREADTPLSGRVEMDDAYLGGARAGGKRGRGAPGKTPFVAAVSTSPEGRPRKVKLVPVKGFRKREIARGAKRWLAPGSEVLTDGLRCWNALDGVVGSHRAIRTGSGRQAARMAPFKWVNTTLGNIKSAITGTYPKLGPDHAQRYLASFAWRYNRRYQLNTMIPRFVHSAARTQPIPYRALIAG